MIGMPTLRKKGAENERTGGSCIHTIYKLK
jgi:hypothetical protein